MNLIPRDEKFFAMFLKQVENISAASSLMLEGARAGNSQLAMASEQIKALESKGDEITHDIFTRLNQTFITPLEREDIQALAAALYKIPKTVEKIGERILIFPADLHGRSFKKHLDLLDQAAETVLAMVKELRKGTDIARAREMNAGLQTIEGDADKLELEMLHDLYHGNYDTKQILFLRDVYELLEKVIDRCRDAGNVILQVVLKHS